MGVSEYVMCGCECVMHLNDSFEFCLFLYSKLVVQGRLELRNLK